jgi:hypothetical protein
MSGKIRDFYPGEALYFTCAITIDDVLQDIRNDSVRVIIKDEKPDLDTAAALDQLADVATQGADGIAIFSIAPTLTDAIEPGGFWLDITWIRAADSYEWVVHAQAISALERVSDV